MKKHFHYQVDAVAAVNVNLFNPEMNVRIYICTFTKENEAAINEKFSPKEELVKIIKMKGVQ